MLKRILVHYVNEFSSCWAQLQYVSCILTCLTQVVRSSGSLQYKDKLIAAIKSTIHLKCKEAATLGATVSRLYFILFANITCYFTLNSLSLFWLTKSLQWLFEISACDIMSRTLKVTGNPVMYDLGAWFLMVIESSPFGAKICSDICSQTLSLQRSEQFSESVARRKLWASSDR